MEDPQLFYEHVIESLWLTLPLLVLLATGLAVLAADVLMGRSRPAALPWIAGGGVAAAVWALWEVGVGDAPRYAFSEALVLDRVTFMADNVILGATLFLVLVSPRWLEGRWVPHGEYYALVTLAAMAMMALGRSAELLALFINFELLSITFYVLVGMEKRNERSSEAGFKYFLLGSFAAAFLLFGIVFVFGATGGMTRLSDIGGALADGAFEPRLMALGLALMLIGFGFKLTLAPFHMYAPDVYEGAPTPIAAAVATGSKIAGFIALLRVVQTVSVWSAPAGVWMAFAAVVVASIVVGNVGALVQPNIKRLLAYSSIAHSGYAMIPLVVILARPDLAALAGDAVVFYMLAYSVMTLLAFGVVGTMGAAGEERISAFAGLGRRAPWRAAAMALAMISLIGFPPTAGFFGKLAVFGVAVAGGLYTLAIIGVLASVASVAYYLRVVVTMYMEEPAEGLDRPPWPDLATSLALGAAAAGIFLAIWPLLVS